jgi:S-layer protein
MEATSLDDSSIAKVSIMKTKKKSLFAWFGRTVAVGLVPLMMVGCANTSSDDKDSLVNQEKPTFSTDPSEGDVITGDSILKVTFNESVSGVTTSSVILKNNGGSTISTTTSSSGNTYSFDPTPNLVTGNYYLTVGEGGSIKDADGLGATAATIEFRVEDALTTIRTNLEADLKAAGIAATDAANIAANAPSAATAATLTNDLMSVVPAAITDGLAYIGAAGSSTAKTTLATSVIESINGSTSLTTSGRTITRVDATAFNELLSRVSAALVAAASATTPLITATEFGNLVSAVSAAISKAGADADQVAALQTTLSSKINTDLSGSTLDSSYSTAANTTTSGQAGTTYDLTTAVNTFAGGSGDDTFRAWVDNSWSQADTIDGGGGTDTFSIIDSGGITATPTGATVKNVETVTISADNVSLTTTTWTGLTSISTTTTAGGTVLTAAATTNVVAADTLAAAATNIKGGKDVTVTATGATTGTITVGSSTASEQPAGAVAVTSTTSTAANTMGAIAVTGGTTVNVTQAAGNAVNTTTVAGPVTVTGGASTTAVTVSDTRRATAAAAVVGRTNGAVVVHDKNKGSNTAAGTIATVTLENFAAASIDSSAISTVNLAGHGTSVEISRGDLTATPTANTLTINVDNLTLDSMLRDNESTSDDGFTTVNVVTNTADSVVGYISFADATALNFTGSKKFTTDNGSDVLTAVTAITSGDGGVSIGTELGTSVLFTGGAGADTISIGTTTKAITMGAGNDKVTTSSAAVGTGGSVNGGDDTDTIVMTDSLAAGADGNATFNTNFTSFEVLELSEVLAASTTLDIRGLNDVKAVTLTNGGADNATAIIDYLDSGSTVTLKGTAGTGLTIRVDGADFSASDTLNLVVSSSSAVDATAANLTALNVETINISAPDATSTGGTAVVHTLVLADNATTINVSGNNGLTLVDNDTVAAVTTFDASGVVANGTADTAALLAVTFAHQNTSSTATVTMTGGAGNDILTGNAGTDTITGGAGNDNLTGGAGVDTLTGGTGADWFKFGTADNSGITGTESITDFTITSDNSTTDKLVLLTTVPLANQTSTAITTVPGLSNLTATVSDGVITLGGTDAGSVDTVGELILIFQEIDNATQQIGAAVMGGNTYVLTDNNTDVKDVIKLTGVTGVTDIARTAAANTIVTQ